MAGTFPVGGAGFREGEIRDPPAGPQASVSPNGEEIGYISPIPNLGARNCWGHTALPRLLLPVPDEVSPEPAACAGAGPCQPGLHSASLRSVHRLGLLPGSSLPTEPTTHASPAGSGLQPTDPASCPPIRQLENRWVFAGPPGPSYVVLQPGSWAGSEQGQTLVAACVGRSQPCLRVLVLSVHRQLCPAW